MANELISHFIILMMENRSYDHYFGALTLEGRDDLDGLVAGTAYSNADAKGNVIKSYSLEKAIPPNYVDGKLYLDPPHEMPEVRRQIGAGMDGFVRSYEKFHKRRKKDPADRAHHVMGYYTRKTLPVLYALADRFAVCDNWYASFAGSTWPNRIFALAGDSGTMHGTGPKWLPRWNAFTYPDPPFVRKWRKDLPLGWKGYSARPEQDSVFALWRVGPVYRGGKGGSLDDFADDCQREKLPNIAIIEPDYGLSDDHPPHHPMRGQQVMSTVVKALLGSPSWARSLLIITYDEHGGFYDHKFPPPSPEGRQKPHDTLGVRVPTLAISAYTQPRTAIKELCDHTTFLKTVAERFGCPVPGPRATCAQIHSLWDTPCFDWSRPPRDGNEILAELPEPKQAPNAIDLDMKRGSKPTGLEKDLRELNLMRELERLDKAGKDGEPDT